MSEQPAQCCHVDHLGRVERVRHHGFRSTTWDSACGSASPGISGMFQLRMKCPLPSPSGARATDTLTLIGDCSACMTSFRRRSSTFQTYYKHEQITCYWAAVFAHMHTDDHTNTKIQYTHKQACVYACASLHVYIYM